MAELRRLWLWKEAECKVVIYAGCGVRKYGVLKWVEPCNDVCLFWPASPIWREDRALSEDSLSLLNQVEANSIVNE